MPKALTRYTVLLSAPGDAARECDIADEELQKINRTHSGETGIEFYPTDWKRDSRADSGDEPQKLLNKQIVEDADIILAIFKERFGTPTSQYGSGTEEEIVLGLEMGKRVLVYFWEPGDGFAPSDVDQFAKITELKQRLQDKTVYKTFDDDVKLGSSIRHDFTKMLFELEGGTISTKPQLALAGIAEDEEMTQESVSLVYPIVLNRLNPSAYNAAVRKAYANVLAIKIPREQTTPHHSTEKSSSAASAISSGMSTQLREMFERLTPSTSLFKSNPVNVSQSSRDLVVAELESLDLDVTEELSNLGGLEESEQYEQYIPTAFGSSEKMLYGSDMEKQKYEALQMLIRKCELRHDFAAFLESNADIGAVSLVITNDGGSLAHHANVDIEIPETACVQPQELVAPSDALMAYGFETKEACEQIINHIFGINETVNFKPYEDSCVRSESGVRRPPLLINYGTCYLKSSDFDDLVEFTFGDYKFIPNSKEHTVLVRLSFDRLQQCRSYAFPTRVLIRNNEIVSIRYRITADELDKAVEGELAVIVAAKK